MGLGLFFFLLLINIIDIIVSEKRVGKCFMYKLTSCV